HPADPQETSFLLLLRHWLLAGAGRSPAKRNPTLRQRRLCNLSPRTTILRFARAGAHPYSC
ncbi:TPA: hypothetical protein ACG4O2_004410, partial [Stenotrophomonas maltophilia]